MDERLGDEETKSQVKILSFVASSALVLFIIIICAYILVDKFSSYKKKHSV